MRPYVKEVESNIQGGVKATLGPKTLIVGANRVGKSSIVRAIELALSGRASDVAGRDTLALDAELFTLAPADAESILSHVVRSDGAESLWTLTRGKKSKRQGQTAIFPLRDVRTAILGSAETARKFFLSVASRVSWDAVLAEIPAQFHERLSPYKSSDGAAGLLAAIEGTKRRVRELNAEAKAFRSTAATTSQGLPPPPSAAEVETARKFDEEAALARHRAGARERLQAAQAEIATFGARLTEVTARATKLEAEWRALPAPLPDVVEHAIAVGEYLAEHKAQSCAICGFAVDPKTFAERAARAKARVAAALEVEKRRAALASEIRNLLVDVKVIERDLERLNEERKRIEPLATSEPTATPSGDYATLLTVAAKWEGIRNAEGRAVEKETEAKIVAQLVELCSTALERLLTKARADFEARVQRFLPESFRFGVDLKDGERDVFRIGLRVPVEQRGDEVVEGLRTALSGAEWSTVTAALASAVAESSAMIGPGEPVIVVPEDRDFDPDTLEAVMRSFGAIDGQVIMTATKPPRQFVEGWTVITIGFTETNGKPNTQTFEAEKLAELHNKITTAIKPMDAIVADSKPSPTVVVRREDDPRWCVECNATIAFGMCDHGKGKPVPPLGDLFAP